MHALRIAKISAGVLLALALLGLVTDALEGLPFTRSAPSWSLWTGGLVLGGAATAVFEGAFDWVMESDRESDPLAKRVMRLGFVLLLMAAVGAVTVLVARAL